MGKEAGQKCKKLNSLGGESYVDIDGIYTKILRYMYNTYI